MDGWVNIIFKTTFQGTETLSEYQWQRKEKWKSLLYRTHILGRRRENTEIWKKQTRKKIVPTPDLLGFPIKFFSQWNQIHIYIHIGNVQKNNKSGRGQPRSGICQLRQLSYTKAMEAQPGYMKTHIRAITPPHKFEGGSNRSLEGSHGTNYHVKKRQIKQLSITRKNK